MRANPPKAPTLTFTVSLDRERKLIVNHSSLRRFSDATGIDPVTNAEAITDLREIILLIWAFAAEEDPAVTPVTIADHLTLEAVQTISSQVRGHAWKTKQPGVN